MRIFITIVLIFGSLSLYGQDMFGVIKDEKPYKVVSIYFAGGRYYIYPSERKKAMEFLNNNILENYEIHIHSHTDNIGSVEYNEWLSRMRSFATKRMLEEEGIPTENIFIKDHGLEDPDYDNDTYEGRLRNRRVDIVLWPLPA